jgi:hypothetical protein
MVWKFNDLDSYLDFFWEVNYYLKKILHKWYALKYGIENIIDWMHVIWKDRDWDEHYLYMIMNKKFERMEKLHREHGHLVRSPRTAHQLMIVKNLTKRLAEHDYLENALADYHRRYGDEFDFFESEPIEGKPNLHRMVDKTPPEQDKAFRKASDHAGKMELQDKIILFKMMNKYIMDWWD